MNPTREEALTVRVPDQAEDKADCINELAFSWTRTRRLYGQIAGHRRFQLKSRFQRGIFIRAAQPRQASRATDTPSLNVLRVP